MRLDSGLVWKLVAVLGVSNKTLKTGAKPTGLRDHSRCCSRDPMEYRDSNLDQLQARPVFSPLGYHSGPGINPWRLTVTDGRSMSKVPLAFLAG